MKEMISISGFADPMSSISHLVGLAIFTCLSLFMLPAAWRTPGKFWYAFQFAIATLFLLSMSFVYHLLAHGGISRAVLLRLDVAAIFVLIASSFTAVHGLLFQDWRRWAIISLLWVITIIGIAVRTVFFDSIPSLVGDGIFLLIGWIGAYSGYLIFHEHGWRGIVPVILGGLCYSIGALMNSTKWPVLVEGVWGPHESFHLMVLAGLGIHWSLIWSLADGSFFRHKSAKASQTTKADGPANISSDVDATDDRPQPIQGMHNTPIRTESNQPQRSDMRRA